MRQQSAVSHAAAAPRALMSASGGRLLQRKCACGKNNAGGGACGACDREGKALRRRAAGALRDAEHTPDSVHEVLNSTGSPLAPATRGLFETRFGHDFSRVRVHTDARAAASARAVNAFAYTVGQQIAFDAGQYAPETPAGRNLLAHELAHTVQQRNARAVAHGEEFELGGSGEPFEREADEAASRVVRGLPPTAASADAHGPAVQRLQRAEKGTYVGTDGPTEYLDAGEHFYKTWGHKNVRRVSTMNEVLDDLDTATGTLDTFRIVSHGTSGGMWMGITPAMKADRFDQTATEYTTPERFRKELAKLEVLNDSTFRSVMSNIKKEKAILANLKTLGADGAIPAADTPLGIVLRAVIDDYYVRNVEVEPDKPGAKPPPIKNRAILDTFNKSRIDTYRPLAVAAAPAADRPAFEKALTDFIADVPAAIAARFNFAKLAESDAKSFADPFTETKGTKKQLKGEIAKQVEEGAEGPYLKRLKSVKSKIDSKTYVEIRGCNIGNNPALLESLRGYFGRPGQLPKISAPDLYQYYFRLSYQTYLNDAKNDARMKKAYDDPDTGLAQGFEDQARMRAGEMMRVVKEKTLSELATKYGRNKTRLRNLNPEMVDPDNLTEGQVVWLVKRKIVSAGFYASLEEFAEKYLEDKSLAADVQAANPHITDPKSLGISVQITLPARGLKPPVAADAPTFADLKAKVRAGQAVPALETFTKRDKSTGQRPRFHMDDANAGQAVADWLAAQKFDPAGRTAAELGALYKGSKFAKQADQTYINFLSRDYPTIVDPIFPEDPRYDKHIIRKP